MDINIEIRISQSSATLEFVPEEARLLIADEDDQFFFQIRWALHICQDFNCKDFELIIFGNVSAVQWLIQGGSQGPLFEGLGLPLLYVLLIVILIFRGKKSKISRNFQGQIRGKIGRFRGEKVKIRGKIGQFRKIFAGEKSNFAEKSADFEGF